MKFSTTVLVITLAATPVAWASDEIAGRVADVQEAARSGAIGSVYELTARVAYPPHPDGQFFAVADDTGTIAIWRNFDWPEDGELKRGDLILMQCEISSTARLPTGAYFREATVLARDKAAHADSPLPSEDEVLSIIAQKNSWWTRKRINITIAASSAILLLTLAWNMMLRTRVNRQGRELQREQAAHIDSTLRIDECTRLAVELHDSVAQNLSGVSLHVDAALRNERTNPGKVRSNLILASAILKSSREELRNCLWDLRSRALDEPDMESAIRQTLRPIMGDVELVISVGFKREELSDNIAHAVLRIIRELVSNSINHGKAGRIEIKGAKDGRRLTFSVSDNGCGFNVEAAPGPADGHFGLSGIRERLRVFAGTMTIDSQPGKGTTTLVSIS